MQPTLAASLIAPERTLGPLVARNGLDARQDVDDVDIVISNVEADSFIRADPRVTRRNRPRRLARSRIEELISADRRKNEFLAVLCHELRSPLASVQNALVILRGRAGEDPA